jgi:cation diffusion facilitator CzcD-associated flavoprotein CzcO
MPVEARKPTRRVEMNALGAIIIGTGQSGPSLAHRLADAGRAPLLVCEQQKAEIHG